MKIIARKRVYWFYGILALMLFFFYLLILQSLPVEVNYSYSDMIMKKILNANRSFKLSLLYFFFVSVTSFVGYIIGSITKDPGYKKSFIISFAVSTVIGFFMFVVYMLS